jgi:hypothetical protein
MIGEADMTYDDWKTNNTPVQDEPVPNMADRLAARMAETNARCLKEGRPRRFTDEDYRLALDKMQEFRR